MSALNVTGGTRYPAGYWLDAGSTWSAPADYTRRIRSEWLAWVAEERERWYASLDSGAPPEWNARGSRSVLSLRPGGAWAGAASTVQTLVSEELAAYWTDTAPRLNLQAYADRAWSARPPLDREDIEASRARFGLDTLTGSLWVPVAQVDLNR